jgi:hypothetical protein
MPCNNAEWDIVADIPAERDGLGHIDGIAVSSRIDPGAIVNINIARGNVARHWK